MVAASVVMVAACGGRESSGGDADAAAAPPESALPEVLFEDSAGVEIRTTPAERVAALEWRVDPTPVAVWDGTEGGLEPFHLIASMAFDTDTSLVLGEMAMTRLRRFTLAGGFDRTIGHPGQGPGEFGAMNYIGFIADSAVIFDSRWNRISVFDPSWEFARLFSLEAMRGGRARFEALLPDGRVFGIASVPRSDRAWGLWSLEGDLLGAIDDLPGLPAITLTALGPSSAHAGSREPMRPFRASRFGAAVGDRILWIEEAGYRFDLVAPDGRRLAAERLDIPARPIDAEVRARWKASMLENFEEGRPDIVRSIEDAEFPEVMPSLGNGTGMFGPTAALHDDQGRVWVAEYPAASPQRWFVFAREGGLAGQVTLPGGFELEAVRGDLLAGVQEDEFDVQTAVVLRLRSSR